MLLVLNHQCCGSGHFGSPVSVLFKIGYLAPGLLKKFAAPLPDLFQEAAPCVEGG